MSLREEVENMIAWEEGDTNADVAANAMRAAVVCLLDIAESLRALRKAEEDG